MDLVPGEDEDRCPPRESAMGKPVAWGSAPTAQALTVPRFLPAQRDAAVWEASTNPREPVGSDPEPLPSSVPGWRRCHPARLCLTREAARRQHRACGYLVQMPSFNLVHETLIPLPRVEKSLKLPAFLLPHLPQRAARTSWHWELQTPGEGTV